MRSVSFFTIILLCIAIIIIDIISFFWLETVMNVIDNSIIKRSIQLLFWTFSVGLIKAIIILKIRLNNINPKRRQQLISSLYGLVVSSFIPKIIFSIIISGLFFVNYTISDKESLFLIPLFGLLSGFLPFFMILYAIFKSTYNFKTYHIKITHPLLPSSLSGLRIVQISDLHLGSFNHKYHILEKVVDRINMMNPDLVVFTGDLVNNYAWELDGWSNCLSSIKAKVGKFAVLGNHDYGDYGTWNSEAEKMDNFKRIKHFFTKIKFTLLLNDSIILDINGSQLAIIGVENWGNPPFKQYGNLNKALTPVKKIPFKILLSHDPSHWTEEVITDSDIALTLSGHTHGMQVGLQYKNLQWSPIKYKYKHWAGLYTNENQHLYVNRGLGWLGFPGRLGMRPEITLIELNHQL